eukprot:327959-Hanusia_phi.AAC.1
MEVAASASRHRFPAATLRARNERAGRTGVRGMIRACSISGTVIYCFNSRVELHVAVANGSLTPGPG